MSNTKFPRLLVLLFVLFVTGCASTPDLKPDLEFNTEISKHQLLPYSELQYLSCDYKSKYPEDSYASISFDLNEKQLEAAEKYFIYSLMSNNVYRDPSEKPIFSLPGWDKPEREVSSSGLAIEKYERKKEGEIVEVVIVFKGTDFSSIKDWMANLSIYFEPDQYRESRKYVENILRENKYKNAKIITTGHSLGGGIALNMANYFEGVDAVAFNSSPRAFYAAKSDLNNEVTMIAESGEILMAIRAIWHRKLRNIKEVEFNFLDFKFGTIQSVQEHSIYYISRGILLAAQTRNDTYAKLVFRENMKNINLNTALNGSKNLDRDLAMCKKLISG